MKENKYLISIIVPVYNTEKYVKKCLNSILKAMDKDCEVIIVNDGSTDNSKNEINEFLQKLPKNLVENFKYIEKKNKGLADTKNVGIENSNGEFISVVDSDDYIAEEFYSVARNYLKKFDILIYDIYVVFEKDSKLNYTQRAYRDWIEDDLASYMNGSLSGSSCNKIIKKSLYDGHKFPYGKQYEDTAVTPFILSEATNIKYLPYPMYYYLQRKNSIVAGNTLSSAFYKICENITEVLKNKKIEKYKYVINEFFVDRALDMLLEDFKRDKSKFKNNLAEYKEKNKDTIHYIVKSNMVYALPNHYSKRQKNTVVKIFEYLDCNNLKKVYKLLLWRKIISKIISKIRRLIRR